MGRRTLRLLLALMMAVGASIVVAPVDAAPGHPTFTSLTGFGTKTGFRGVLAWQADTPIVAQVEYGIATAALTQTPRVAYRSNTPDSGGMAFVDGLNPDTTYYWRVRDLLTNRTSDVKTFRAGNAYNNWNGSAYTINLVVQLDTESLPAGIPADLALANLAQTVDVTAERIYDALDGRARIGSVLVTDTVADHAANMPALFGTVCAGNNLADVLIQTSVPFDSHTWSPWAIADRCTFVSLGRLGQLVVPWGWDQSGQEDLHAGYTLAHELLHYAFNAPDLYRLNSTADCTNTAWDGSIMHNTGGWDGTRWHLTELDESPSLTPCAHGVEPYSWPTLRGRYTNVPARSSIDHVVDTQARGNADGGALEVWILDREPSRSTLTKFTPINA